MAVKSLAGAADALAYYSATKRSSVLQKVHSGDMIDGVPITSDAGNAVLSDPIAFFITVPTYGTWLPGDQRGWVELRYGWQPPKPKLELECAAKMTEDTCWLSKAQRRQVEVQIAETCRYRNWKLFAVACLSNHMHIVVSALDEKPVKIRSDLKSWCTRRLKMSNPDRKNWWADRGSVRWIWNQLSLDKVVEYTNDAQ